MEVKEEKQKLRKELKKVLSQLSEDSRIDLSAQITGRVQKMDAYLKGRCLFIYVSKSDEVQTLRLIQEALSQGKEVFVPKVSQTTGLITVCQIKDWEKDLEPGFYGILEPKNQCPVLEDLSQIDLFLIPGLGFDKQGNRLGRGKGMFDQFLSVVKNKDTIIALAFDCQVVSQIPSEAHDFQMPCVVTEKQVLEIKGS